MTIPPRAVILALDSSYRRLARRRKRRAAIGRWLKVVVMSAGCVVMALCAYAVAGALAYPTEAWRAVVNVVTAWVAK